MINKLNTNKNVDYFTRPNYPNVFDEINVMTRQITEIAGGYKREILISFLKNHSIKVAWLTENDEFVNLITSGALKIQYTERLFEAKRTNKEFLVDLEGFIETELRRCLIEASHSNVLNKTSWGGKLPAQHYYACA